MASLARLSSMMDRYDEPNFSVSDVIGFSERDTYFSTFWREEALFLDEHLTPPWWPRRFWATGGGSTMTLSDDDRPRWFVSELRSLLARAHGVESDQEFDHAVARAILEWHLDFEEAGIEALGDPFEALELRVHR